MSRRTLDNCSLIKYCVLRGLGYPIKKDGKCFGYQKSEFDDEPCEKCRKCKLNEFYEEE